MKGGHKDKDKEMVGAYLRYEGGGHKDKDKDKDKEMAGACLRYEGGCLCWV